MLNKDSIIGLDIGSSSIKLAQFAERAGGLCLVRAEIKEVAQTPDAAAYEKEAVSALKELFRGIDARKARIIVSINCLQSAIKSLTVPYMPKAELREGIKLQAKDYFPFSIDESTLSLEITGELVEKGVKKYGILVAVCPSDAAGMYLSLLNKAGIRPASLVSSAYALQKVAEAASVKEGEAVCFVDIGERFTELVIVKGRNLMFARKIPVSGIDFTKAMMGTLTSDRGKIQLTAEEAEKIKREIGIPSESAAKIIDGKISTAQIASMLMTPVERLTGEIEMCHDYYREESGEGRVNSVVFFGGGASLGGLIAAVSRALGIEAKLGDPLTGIRAENGAGNGILSRLDAAVGAALSSAKGINLLPPEIKEKRMLVIAGRTLKIAAFSLIPVLALIFFGIRGQIGDLQKRITAARQELSGLEGQFRKAEAKIVADKVLVNEPQWEDVFTELSNLVPPEIHLSAVSMRSGAITIRGTAVSEDAAQVLSDFVLTLEKGLFSDVKLIGSRKSDEGPGTLFELRCWIDYE